jgi:hypothetical protein
MEAEGSATSLTHNFDNFRSQFVARTPNLAVQQFPDETEDSRNSDEVRPLTIAPAAGCAYGDPEDQGTKFLWLVCVKEIPAALENGELGRSMKRGRLAHTNLSGGEPAHCGGELWFRDDHSMWLNGASGRYHPRSAEELEAVAQCFRNSGYLVACCGWDEETNKAARLFRDANWK